jgi:hypothetical protein
MGKPVQKSLGDQRAGRIAAHGAVSVGYHAENSTFKKAWLFLQRYVKRL